MSSFSVTQLLLNYLRLNLEIGEFISQPLVLNSEALSFLFAFPHFLLEQYTALNSSIVFVFHVLQGRSGIPGLSLIIIIGDFYVAQL